MLALIEPGHQAIGQLGETLQELQAVLLTLPSSSL